MTPKGIARVLSGHTVTKAKERGWDTLSNGALKDELDLIRLAEAYPALKSMHSPELVELIERG